jgi:dimethylhistidine N-methyltransferase
MAMDSASHPQPAQGRGPDTSEDHFLQDVLDGLGNTAKSLPCKYFYDAQGSQLFDQICSLEEYYPTRTETALLTENAPSIASAIGPKATIVEFGSGSSVKIRILLDALENPCAYVPVDISEDHMLAAADALGGDYPDLTILPVAADYTHPFDLPAELPPMGRTGFFPGSTIGNFPPNEACAFLSASRRSLGANCQLLIGVDLKKPTSILHAAYNDAAGVTAAFNLNLLRRINRELGGDFTLDRFAHDARYNAADGRIEMYLVSREAQRVTIDGRDFDFAAGEKIHTENSYKYAIDEFHALAARAGWSPAAWWTDPADLFSVHLLDAA